MVYLLTLSSSTWLEMSFTAAQPQSPNLPARPIGPHDTLEF